jgi:hypothetical protein
MAPEFVEGVHLRRTEENAAEIDALAELCGGRVGVDAVLDDLNRKARRTWVPGLKVSRGLWFDWHDLRTRRWWPQGITTSADASEGEDLGGRRCVAISWYSTSVAGFGKGTRISFLDLDARRYRHVLLVRPVLREDGTVDLEPLKAHAGGIVWSGPYLHIAATRKGFHTARIGDIIRVPDHLRVADHTRVGRGVDGLGTFDYPYVLPVRFSYVASHDEGVEPLRFSFLSIDRSASPWELVAGEYGRGRQTTRLVRFPLDPENHHLASDEDGLSRPLLLDDKGEAGMQGATIVNGTWYVTSSRGPAGLGTLYVGEPGRFRGHRWALPIGPEDISYWPSTDELWSVTEHPWRRWVFAIKRSRLG